MKFTALNTHYKPGLALECKSSPGERGKTNQMEIKRMNTVICFTEVRFLKNVGPVEVVTKTGSLSTFPSLKRSLRSSELSP
jgi:hypothetical protein